MIGAVQQRDAADEGWLKPCGSAIVGTAIELEGKVVHPSQLIACVGRTIGAMRDLLVISFFSLLAVGASGDGDDIRLKVVASEDSQIPMCYLGRVQIADDRIAVQTVDSEYRDFERTRQLTMVELTKLKKIITRASFFSLPKVVGCVTSATYERRLWIEVAGRDHSVVLRDRCSCPKCASTPQETDRAYAVWEAIRSMAQFAMAEACPK
jgi:hypothetical protein